ncbi:MAG: hypothetical protein JKY94_01015 [Rhodobacteraceae bacterium]|nr:hypothetical protein [Paracoccaceae bacterium]
MTNPTHAEQWEPPADVKPWMVCAACRSPDGFIAMGSRHWSDGMWVSVKLWQKASSDPLDCSQWDQGFIDQWDRFYTREEAMQAVKASGQPFNAERNGGNGHDLYSEGLY